VPRFGLLALEPIRDDMRRLLHWGPYQISEESVPYRKNLLHRCISRRAIVGWCSDNLEEPIANEAKECFGRCCIATSSESLTPIVPSESGTFDEISLHLLFGSMNSSSILGLAQVLRERGHQVESLIVPQSLLSTRPIVPAHSSSVGTGTIDLTNDEEDEPPLTIADQASELGSLYQPSIGFVDEASSEEEQDLLESLRLPSERRSRGRVQRVLSTLMVSTFVILLGTYGSHSILYRASLRKTWKSNLSTQLQRLPLLKWPFNQLKAQLHCYQLNNKRCEDKILSGVVQQHQWYVHSVPTILLQSPELFTQTDAPPINRRRIESQDVTLVCTLGSQKSIILIIPFRAEISQQINHTWAHPGCW
jgi:hypothetical protein